MFLWQQEQFNRLWEAKSAGRLPHALLLSGLAGMGKAVFADDFSQALLCHGPVLVPNKVGAACGVCHACRLVTGRAHPNVLWLTPEKVGQTIKVDQVRDVRDFINQTSLQGEYRVVIIHPADQMNTNAANALLKLLEEPAANAILILISDQSGQLPATILSRCQKINFTPPSAAAALTWLSSQLKSDQAEFEQALLFCHGAPLAALSYLKEGVSQRRQLVYDSLSALDGYALDPITAAKKLQDIELLQLIDFFLSWLMDLLSMQVKAESLTNRDYLPQLTKLAASSKIESNVKFMLDLQIIRGHICRGFNFNKQLLIESVLIKWMECSKCL